MKNKQIFKEEVKVEKESITITVSCVKRTHIGEKKAIYEKNMQLLIPEDLRSRTVLVSCPQLRVSNINNSNVYTNVGVWEYKILNDKEKPLGQKKKSTNRNTTTSVKTPARSRNRTRQNKK